MGNSISRFLFLSKIQFTSYNEFVLWELVKLSETISLSKQTQTEASRNVESCFPAQEKPESRVKNTDVC